MSKRTSLEKQQIACVLAEKMIEFIINFNSCDDDDGIELTPDEVIEIVSRVSAIVCGGAVETPTIEEAMKNILKRFGAVEVEIPQGQN